MRSNSVPGRSYLVSIVAILSSSAAPVSLPVLLSQPVSKSWSKSNAGLQHSTAPITRFSTATDVSLYVIWKFSETRFASYAYRYCSLWDPERCTTYQYLLRWRPPLCPPYFASLYRQFLQSLPVPRWQPSWPFPGYEVLVASGLFFGWSLRTSLTKI